MNKVPQSYIANNESLGTIEKFKCVFEVAVSLKEIIIPGSKFRGFGSNGKLHLFLETANNFDDFEKHDKSRMCEKSRGRKFVIFCARDNFHYFKMAKMSKNKKTIFSIFASFVAV